MMMRVGEISKSRVAVSQGNRFSARAGYPWSGTFSVWKGPRFAGFGSVPRSGPTRDAVGVVKKLVGMQALLIGAVILRDLHHLDRHQRARDVFKGVGCAGELFLTSSISGLRIHEFAIPNGPSAAIGLSPDEKRGEQRIRWAG
jgi:hypothetical protein